MKTKKKIAMFLVAIVASIAILPETTANATEAPAGHNSNPGEEYSSIRESDVVINPVYENIITEEDIASHDKPAVQSDDAEFDSSADYEADTEKIIATLRNRMELRENNIRIYYVSDAQPDYDLLNGWIMSALEETESPTQGDYLKYVMGGCRWDCSSTVAGGKYYSVIDFDIMYMTTLEQENELTAELDRVISGFSFTSDTTDVEKINVIYDYICKNISYDHANLADENYKLKYTAYAALINKTAVCQGYASLLYRMLETVGIDARVITGVSHGENHAWNIAKADGKYYNLDSTWDAGVTDYNFFLKCNEHFSDHEREDKFLTSEFEVRYPMSGEDYLLLEPSDTVLIEGDFKYVISKKRAKLIDYMGSAPDVTVPSVAGGYPVETIGTYAFYGKETIERLTFSEGIINMENEAVFSCPSLVELNLPVSLAVGVEDGSGVVSGLSCIPQYCDKLESVHVPETSQKLCARDGVLYNKDMTALLYYPSGKADEIFTIPDGIKIIGNSSFQGSKVKKIIMPDTVTYIGYWAFSGACALKEINISTNCTMIGQLAFQSTAIESLVLPASLEGINLYGTYFNDLESFVVDEDNPFYSSHEGVLYNKDKTRMQYCPPAKKGSYIIPDSVLSICEGAIHACSLSDITIPSSAAIAVDNFYSYPEQFVIYGYEDSAAQDYAQNKGIEFISIGTSPEFEIASGSCGNEVTWTFNSKGVLVIKGTGTMEPAALETRPWEDYRTAIRTVIVEEGVENISDYAFWDHLGLTRVILPSTVKKIENSAFGFCRQLSEITIPESVVEIEEFAFASCESLTNVMIPAGVNKIGRCAFSISGGRLQSITVDLENPNYCSIDGVLFNKDKTELLQYPAAKTGNYIVPEGTLFIGEMAFEYARAEFVKLPDSVIRIGESAFLSSSIQGIFTGDGVTDIEDYAFFSSQGLTKVYIGKNVSYIGNNIFGGCHSLNHDGTIYYPCSKEKWDDIVIESNNEVLKNAHMEYGYEYDINSICWFFHKLTYVPQKEPGCTESGNTGYYVCDGCGQCFGMDETEEIQLEETVIPAMGHRYGTEWVYDESMHFHICERCSDKNDFASHTFVWKVDMEATTASTGVKHEECSVCGCIRNEGTIIEKIPEATARPEPTATPVAPTSVPTATPGAGINPGQTPDAEPSEMPAETPSVIPSQTPDAEPSEMPVVTPGVTQTPDVFLPPVQTPLPVAPTAMPTTTPEPVTTLPAGQPVQPDSSPVQVQSPSQVHSVTGSTTVSPIQPSAAGMAVKGGLKLAAGKKKLTLKWKKVANASGYEIQVSRKKNFKGAKKLSLKSSKKSHTIKKLKRGKIYYVRIRAYTDIDGKKVYGKWVMAKKKVS